MSFEFIDNTPTGQTVYRMDGSGRLEVIERRVDVQPTLDFNEAIRNELSGYTPSKEMKLAARIPSVVWEDLERRGIAHDDKKLRAWLNENWRFKASEGTL